MGFNSRIRCLRERADINGVLLRDVPRELFKEHTSCG